MIKSIFILYFVLFFRQTCQNDIKVYGPGLQPKNIVMPARYFFINFTSANEISYSQELANNLAIDITGRTSNNIKCRIWTNKLDRKDGTFIIRYKVYETCYDLSINIYYKKKHISKSPYEYKGPIHSSECDCPQIFKTWFNNYGCPSAYNQIHEDLKFWPYVNMTKYVRKIIKKLHSPESTSFCHYVVKNNQVYRDCYGKHVGFNMFADNILLFMARIVILPDMEFVMNLGDWPLAKKYHEPLPIFSWCGNDENYDIVLPTYDLTESTLENMGRVTLDILSVQGSIERQWKEREPRAIWRGRDSRAERLKLIDIARENPDLINASLTNFFFFRDKEEQYGPKQPHISFFNFFDYKYIINIDGTVAAYRLPYLLAGGGMVLKQDSPYYEYFYKQLRSWEHYVPIARDLSDLTEKIQWAQLHDEQASKIAENARHFANENLLPQHVFCYYAVLFYEWSVRLATEVEVLEDMTHVRQPKYDCDCKTGHPQDSISNSNNKAYIKNNHDDL